jgi:hypothetical protein
LEVGGCIVKIETLKVELKIVSNFRSVKCNFPFFPYIKVKHMNGAYTWIFSHSLTYWTILIFFSFHVIKNTIGMKDEEPFD